MQVELTFFYDQFLDKFVQKEKVQTRFMNDTKKEKQGVQEDYNLHWLTQKFEHPRSKTS